MNPLIRKSKMISFRLSPEEYRTLQNACVAKGLRSISDLARAALQSLAVSDYGPSALSEEVRDLKERVRLISAEVDRLSQRVESGGKAADQGVTQ